MMVVLNITDKVWICQIHSGDYYALKACAPHKNSYFKALHPNVTVFGDGAIRMQLRFNEGVRVRP